MENSAKGVFKTAFKRTLGATAGFAVGIWLLALVFNALSTNSSDPEIDYNFNVEVLPNDRGERKILPSKSPVILKVNMQGVIGLDDLTRQKLAGLLVESREKTLKGDRVKGILLCIDSPGGTVVDADGIYQLLRQYKEQYSVPIYAYVDGLCASGGMYIACSADKIFASNSSAIGSVGVLMPTVLNFYDLMQTLGIESKTITAGKYKDELNPLRKWQSEEGNNYQQLVDSFYSTFIDVVASNRKALDKEKLVAEYGAKVFPAAAAAELGYIDQSGITMRKAMALLAEEVGLAEGTYQVVELKEKNWLLSLFQGKGQRVSGSCIVTHRLDLPPECDSRLANKFLYLYRP